TKDYQWYEEEYLYNFQSCQFLTEDALVKYYEPEDIIYVFSVDAKDKTNIVLSNKGGTLSSIDYGSVTMLKDSYKELNSEYTLSLIEESMVKEIETEAIVISLGDGIIYVTSEKTPTLSSISLFLDATIYQNGKEVDASSISDEEDDTFSISVEEGDILQFRYYQRYPEYQPKDIYVSYINILKK
ncbi:MAG: hypothetical protein K2I88_04875, partial [Anaeroplasmataceae bacterium]|nr:hypothetical protein [Anaeroplasmataceae bacterium]